MNQDAEQHTGQARPPIRLSGRKQVKLPKSYYGKRIHDLQRQIDNKLHELTQLHNTNTALKVKETVLHRSIAEQGDHLHYVALASAALGALEGGQCTDMANQVASCLLQDLEAFQLLKAASSDAAEELPQQQEELYTSACLRAAVTPTAVQQMRAATFSDRCRMTRDIVMRLGFHMCMRQSREQQEQQQQQRRPPPPQSGSHGSTTTSGQPQPLASLQQQQQRRRRLPVLQQQLEDVVDDFVQLLMLMSAASFVVAQRLCYINLETEEPQTPPAGHWSSLVQQLELRPEQLEQLRVCFDMYTTDCSPLLEQVHELSKEMQQLMSEPAPAGLAGAAVAALSKQARWQRLDLEELLLELEPCLDNVAQRSRILTFQVLNILDKLQIATAVLNAFPWILNVVQVCRAAAFLPAAQAAGGERAA